MNKPPDEQARINEAWRAFFTGVDRSFHRVVRVFHLLRVGAFEITHIGRTPGDDRAAAADIVAPFAEAGVTWWLERIGDRQDPLEMARPRVQQGPPRIG